MTDSEVIKFQADCLISRFHNYCSKKVPCSMCGYPTLKVPDEPTRNKRRF